MKRVASLWLPSWSIDRLRRTERRRAPSAEADARAAYDAISADAAADRATHCSVPKEGGWRPGARWARSDPADGGSGLAETRGQVEAAIEALPAHRRPPQRELGRTSEAAGAPFKDGPSRKSLSRPPEERVAAPAPLRELSRRTEAAGPLFKPGTRGWHGEDLQAAVAGLPAHQRPKGGELSRKSETIDNPFRLSPDDVGPNLRHGRPDLPPLRFPGEDAPAKAGRGAALRGEHKRDRHRNEAPSIRRLASMPSVNGPGEDVIARRAMKTPRRSARDGHGGEAGYVAPPNVAQSLKQLAAMPAVQFPGEGPHADDRGRGGDGASSYGQGRFFQTGRTLSSVVARVYQDEEAAAGAEVDRDEPPMVTVRKVGSRVEVAAANAAARLLGIGPGTALTMARAQVPELEVREADPDGDAASLASLAELLARRWAPSVAICDADGLFIDLTGVTHLHGGEARFCRRLLRLLARHGVSGRIAVADTAGAAWALARFGSRGPAQLITPGAHGSAVEPLPVAALRLDPPALELLARLGIDTVGQLLAMPRKPLVRRFGRATADRLDQATGRAPEPFEPVVPPTRVVVEQRFAEPIATPEAITHWLGQLMPQLTAELAKAGQGARSVEMVAARVDGVPQRLRLGFARPTRDAAHMLRLTLRRMDEIEPGYGFDAIALHVRRADPLGAESLAPALADETTPDLAPLIDALANRIGISRLWRAVPVESDVPERSCGRKGPLDAPPAQARALRVDDVRRLDARTTDEAWHPRWRRPVMLLRRPERVDHVMAELPDSPPRRFTWRGTSHRIIHAEGPERISGEWWRRAPERLAVRDYFRVEDETGQRFWLFRRGDGMRAETGDLSWFVHGLGD